MDHPRNSGRDPDSALIADAPPPPRARPSRLQRWLRPPRVLRPTRAGWLFFCITMGVGFAALNTGNNLLYMVLSLLLAFLVLSGVLSESSLRGIRVRRRIPSELEAGSDGRVVLEVTNELSRFVSFAIVVVDRAAWQTGPPVEVGRAFALRVGAGETVRRHYRFRPAQRGYLHFEEFQVFTRFPFGLFSKSMRISAPQTALVYPEIERVDAGVLLGSPHGTGEQVPAPGGVGADAVGLRDYADGDPVRRIHWRASMRKRELLVREVDSERDAEFEVRLRTRDVSEGDAFERSIRWAASEVSALLDHGTRVSLRTDRHFIASGDGPRQRARLLSFLALVRTDDSEPHVQGPGDDAVEALAAVA